MSDPPPGPLAGIRVIDVGTRISAPFCAGLLGELGAGWGVLQTALSNVSQQRLSLDSSLNRIQTASSFTQTDATNRTATVSTLVSADPATVVLVVSVRPMTRPMTRTTRAVKAERA